MSPAEDTLLLLALVEAELDCCERRVEELGASDP